jgi:hypothetical protein
MKYLILITSLIATSTHSIIGMDDTYKEMLGRIGAQAIGHPSITLVNKSNISLWMAIGSLEKDGIHSQMPLHKNAELTFSPYTTPFCLNEKYSKRGTVVDLYTTRPEKKDCQHKELIIGEIAEIKFGATVLITYEDDALKLTHYNAGSLKKPIQKTLVIKRNSTK